MSGYISWPYKRNRASKDGCGNLLFVVVRAVFLED